MKKFITLTLTAAIIASGTTAFAMSVPRESAPQNATEEQIQLTENIIGGILDEVAAGAGYGIASTKADTKIYKVVIGGNTNGYGYAILSAISQNAIRTVRDMYMRPDYYKAVEEKLTVLLADIITDVQNGKDYNIALDEAYTRIYQSANPSYNPNVDKAGDFCYWNIPQVDSAELTVARKLLLQAKNSN